MKIKVREMAPGKDHVVDAFKEINFKFDDDLSVNSNNNNTEVVIHRKQRRPLTNGGAEEEEDFRRNCRQMNTSTPKKPNQSDIRLAMSSARNSFFGLDDETSSSTANNNISSHYDDPVAIHSDTAEILATVCSQDQLDNSSVINRTNNNTTCDINNNQEKRSSGNKESESGLGSISAASDEVDAKLSPEKERLLENEQLLPSPAPPVKPRNIIREPQYYAKNPSQVSIGGRTMCIMVLQL